MKTLKKQYDDLEIVSQRMEEQYKTMDQAYREEIKQIVKALDNQFDARIFDWERKAKELSEKEENFLEVKYSGSLRNKSRCCSVISGDHSETRLIFFFQNRLKLREEQQALIDELRMRDAEDVHATKIKLETDVQVLEQQLESMRASYQLNQEKLVSNSK